MTSEAAVRQLIDRLHLEIEAPDLAQLVANHSGQDQATTGWTPSSGDVTISAGQVAGTVGAFAVGTAQRYLAGTYFAGGAGGMLSPSFAVAPGQFVGVQFSYWSQPTRLLFYGVRFYDSGGVQLDDPTAPTPTLLTDEPAGSAPSFDVLRATRQTERFKAPAGTVTGRLIVGIRPLPPTATQPAPIPLPNGAQLRLARVMVVKGPTDVAVRDVPFTTEATVWQDILGAGLSVRTSRGGRADGVLDAIDAGLLTAAIRDPLIDPLRNDRVRPGRRVRLQLDALPSQLGFGRVAVWTGRVTKLDVSYGDDKGLAPALVTIQAADLVAELRGIASPYSYSGSWTARMNRLLLDAPTIPKAVSDDQGGLATATRNGVAESANLWDQLILSRNSSPAGKVYVREDGTLIATTLSPTYGNFLFSGDAGAARSYVELDATFGSDALVNTLTVRKRASTEPDGEKVYGPYVNAASVAAWGTVAAEVDVIDGVPATLATEYLQRFANPGVFPSSITVNVADVQTGTTGDYVPSLFQHVRVLLTSAGLDRFVYIVGVDHDVTPNGWRATLYLRPTDAKVADAISSPAAGPNTGPADVLGPRPVPYADAAVLTANYTTTTTATDLAGVTLTVPVVQASERYLVTAVVDVRSNQATAANFIAELLVDTTAQTGQVICNWPVSQQRGTVAQTWIVTGLTPGSHVFKLRARTSTSGSTHLVSSTHTGITVSAIPA